MIGVRSLAVSISLHFVFDPFDPCAGLSRYREFQLGTTLLEVAKQIDVKPSQAKLTSNVRR